MTILKIAMTAALTLGLATAVHAQTTISAVSSFPEGTLFSVNFEKFVKDFNAANGSEITIDYKGGAPAIGSPFTLGERVQRGQFDLMSIHGPYYETTVPVSLALSLADVPMDELRETDWIDAMQEAHEARGLHYLGKVVQGAPFQLYLSNPITSADLTGLRLRVQPLYQPFFGALGATTIRSDLTEIYTLMENGSIDGFGWPIIGFLPDWINITAYRVEPGFYDTDINLVMNLETWNRLTDHQKMLFEALVAEYEAMSINQAQILAEESRAKMAAAGMQINELSGEAAEKFSATALESAWETVIARDPEFGERLRKAQYGD